MKRSYWKNYVHETDANEIERNIQRTGFTSSAKNFELIYFEAGKNTPNILISPGCLRYTKSFPLTKTLLPFNDLFLKRKNGVAEELKFPVIDGS